MRFLTGLTLALLISASASAIPGVTIPFPGEGEDATEDATAEAQANMDAALELDEQSVVDTPPPAIVTDPIEAGPHLSSNEYPRSEYEAGNTATLTWRVRREAMDGTDLDGSVEHVLIVGPDFVNHHGAGSTILYDFAHARRLTLDMEARTIRNDSFYGDIRQRLDTYFGLSQGGTLDDIPYGPDRSFDRFWLEAAMGLRRTPVALTSELSSGMMRVGRDGVTVFAFSKDADDTPSGDDDSESDVVLDLSEETDTDGEAEDPGSDADLLALLRADNAAADEGDDTADEPDTAGESEVAIAENAQAATDPLSLHADIFRRWMRHALPIHPDAMSTMDGETIIPARFELIIVSPASPEGRREIWTLESVDSAAAELPLPANLSTVFPGPEDQIDRVIAAAMSTMDSNPDEHTETLMDEVEAYRSAGNLTAAFLAAYQDSAHVGLCSQRTLDRPSCNAINQIVAAGLGTASFERLFAGITAIASGDHQLAYEAVEPFLDLGGYAGASANIIAGNEIIAWVASGGEPPEEANPFEMLVTAIENDPAAAATYWHLGQAWLTTGERHAGWAAFDVGRVVDGEPYHRLLAQSYILEDRLRQLAPDFFLPQ